MMNFKDNLDESRLALFKSKSADFWKDLAALASGANLNRFATTLGVSSNQMRKWPVIIKQALEEIENQKSADKKIVMPTGQK